MHFFARSPEAFAASTEVTRGDTLLRLLITSEESIMKCICSGLRTRYAMAYGQGLRSVFLASTVCCKDLIQTSYEYVEQDSSHMHLRRS